MAGAGGRATALEIAAPPLDVVCAAAALEIARSSPTTVDLQIDTERGRSYDEALQKCVIEKLRTAHIRIGEADHSGPDCYRSIGVRVGKTAAPDTAKWSTADPKKWGGTKIPDAIVAFFLTGVGYSYPGGLWFERDGQTWRYIRFGHPWVDGDGSSCVGR